MTQLHAISEIVYICYNAGSGQYIVEEYNPNIEWHQEEFQGTYQECLLEAQSQEWEKYRFDNCLPHESNC